MEDKKQETKENNFKFGLFLRSDKVYEKLFSADLYNPVVRYSVNIREMIPKIVLSLQTTLQTKSKDLNFVDKFGYNSLDEYKRLCDINDLDYYKLKVPTNFPKTNHGGKPYMMRGGTEFKFGLYINHNTIVERNFYVDNYNPESRFSTQLMDVINVIVENISTHLKHSDLNHMWDDYKIINTYGLNIQQVRELSKERREELLRRVGDYNFIERIRMDYSKSQAQQEFTV